MKRYRTWWVAVGVAAVAVVGFGFLRLGAARGPQITVEDIWARPQPKVAESGEVYMIIRNTGSEPDRLVGGSSSACGMVAMNERYRTPEGAMSMRTAEEVEIPGRQRVELKVDGLHVMCMEKKQEFKPGVQLPLTLRFEKFGDVQVQVTIRDQ